ncbi:DUF488 domain-containing protein [Sinorhizobium meliloti]|uniref:DUF488 domain-containing protein n=1 Tax=Rhizobium meliloti TaxID=382 RepID=UPI00138B1B8C|nr:DUF488 domain-containing protein [Sinorhizobium meliloti]
MIVNTIGYEGAEIVDFISVLEHTGTEVLVDVRDVPSSRKRGFSKNALKSAVEQAGMSYVHLKVLGDPKPGREAARNGDFSRFREIFCEHISNDGARLAIRELVQRAKVEKICLMCFERDHKECHRNILVEEMKKICNFEVHHLGVPKGFHCKAA